MVMLAIDVGNRKVCVVDGSCRGEQIIISSWGEAEYTAEFVSNGVIKDRVALANTISRLLKSKHIKSSSAFVTINSKEIITRNLTFPNVKNQVLQVLVKNEMTEFLGPENDYIIDFINNGTTPENMLNIICYAVPTHIVKDYYYLLKDLHKKPAAMDINAVSMYKLIGNSTKINGCNISKGNVIVTDIGYSKMNLHVYCNGEYELCRTESSPVQDFANEMATLVGKEANIDLMSRIDLSPEKKYDNPAVGDACRYFIFRLVDDIQHYIQYVVSSSADNSIEKIYLCGGISRVHGIDEALSSYLKIPVEVVSSIDRISAPRGCPLNCICYAAGALIRL